MALAGWRDTACDAYERELSDTACSSAGVYLTCSSVTSSENVAKTCQTADAGRRQYMYVPYDVRSCQKVADNIDMAWANRP